MTKIGKNQIKTGEILKREDLVSIKGGVEYPTFTCRIDCEGNISWFTFSTTNCYPEDEFCATMQCNDFYEPVCSNPNPCNCMSGS
jgi:hypothetical protein